MYTDGQMDPTGEYRWSTFANQWVAEHDWQPDPAANAAPPKQPWYANKALLAMFTIIVVLGLVVIGFVAVNEDTGTANETEKVIGNSGSAWVPDTQDDEAPPSSGGGFSGLSNSDAYDYVMENYPGLRIYSQSEFDGLAETMCEAFDAGVSFDKAAELGFESGFDSDEVGALVAYAVATQCQRHSDIAD